MRNRRGFTLIELLVVVGISAVLLSLVGTLFASGWTATHRARRQAGNSQLVSIIVKRWQKELSESDPQEWTIRGSGFRAGELAVYVEEGRLVFQSGDSTKTVKLSHDMACEFAVDRNEDVADCAVLTLNMRSYCFESIRTNSVRIVACGKVVP
jgi:prepilin-type N-terminal cleavage/methylation domain-containing protein